MKGTLNRVGEPFPNRLEINGHAERPEDLGWVAPQPRYTVLGSRRA